MLPLAVFVVSTGTALLGAFQGNKRPLQQSILVPCDASHTRHVEQLVRFCFKVL